MAARVKVLSAGIVEVLKSPGVKADLHRRAEAVAAQARGAAPVDTGAYRDSITVEDVDHPTRSVSRVVASDRKAGIVEAKTGNLARALDAAGGGS